MLKSFIYTILLFSSFLISAQNDNTVNLRCELTNCVEDVVSLYRFNGGAFIPIQQVQTGEDGSFQFQVPTSEPRFYYVGTNAKNRLPIILGTEENVILRGPCNAIPGARFTQSKINNDYAQLKQELSRLSTSSSQLIRKYQQVFGEEREAVAQKMTAIDSKKKTLLDSLRAAHPFFAKIVALNTYLSFQNNAGEYKNEIEYFAKEYFRHADLTDPVYEHLPWVYEAYRNYTNTIIGVRLPIEKQKVYLENALNKTKSGSGAHQLAISGVITTLNQKSNELFPYFAQQFIEAFAEKDPAAVASMKEELKKAKAFMIGGQAPDFTQNTPEGEAMNLSDLKGKVVLIDFWASWCGPCRRENPNVVRVYEQYKDQGFDILGVSLDRSKDKWLGAIEKDGLNWHHVSDLKGWQNEAAGMYGVRSIPHTVLLDREGKVIARNLRGPALENKLKEIFE